MLKDSRTIEALVALLMGFVPPPFTFESKEKWDAWRRGRERERLLFAIAVIVALIGIAFVMACTAFGAERKQTIRGQVVSVIDSDTCRVTTATETVKVRCRWVDGPELKQPGGEDARQHFAKLCLGKHVTVIVSGRSYDRFVGDIQIDGKSVISAMVRDGFGWPDERFATRASREVLDPLWSAAKEEKKGVWAEGMPTPIAPWLWRKGQR